MSNLKTCCRGLVLAVILLTPCRLWAQNETIAVLEAGSQTYSNVTVTSKTSQYIIISHAHGLASIKLKDLSDDILKQLGYAVDPPVKPKPTLLSGKLALDPRIKEMQEKFTQEAQERFRQLDPRLVQGALAVLGLLYLFFCYCSMLICKKTGQEPGVLVWIPIIQTFPLLKAAGMSAWWFLLVPVATICWCVKICRARGKSSWLGLFLLLPVTNVFTYLYLAFADGGNEKEATPERITFD